MLLALRLLLVLPAVVCAFSSISADYHSNLPSSPPLTPTRNNGGSSIISSSDNQPILATTDSASPWRVALDIGREPLARMPFDWARSGCRMPLVIPTDFTSSNVLLPHSDTVMCTGEQGAVVRPITGEKWELSNDEKTITLSYTLQEKMMRRDVYIDAGTELILTGRVYTQKEMDQLNNEYYEAREELWKVGKYISDI